MTQFSELWNRNNKDKIKIIKINKIFINSKIKKCLNRLIRIFLGYNITILKRIMKILIVLNKTKIFFIIKFIKSGKISMKNSKKDSLIFLKENNKKTTLTLHIMIDNII